ncbi:MAG: GAF domain-containing protein [Nitrospira sp.]|nr:MAG: GAF domain-containing protein [Nitrospira sp.]
MPPGTAVPWYEGIAGTVYRTGLPEIVPDAQTDARHFKKVDEATGAVTHDMITIPLKRWEGDPVGVIQVMNKRGEGVLGPDDLAPRLRRTPAAHSSTALQLWHPAQAGEIIAYCIQLCRQLRSSRPS